MSKRSEIILLPSLLRLRNISKQKEKHNWKSTSKILNVLPINIRSLRPFLSNIFSISQLITSNTLPSLNMQLPLFPHSSSLIKSSTPTINFQPLKDSFSQRKTDKCSKPLSKEKNFTLTSQNSHLSKTAWNSCLKILHISSWNWHHARPSFTLPASSTNLKPITKRFSRNQMLWLLLIWPRLGILTRCWFNAKRV